MIFLVEYSRREGQLITLRTFDDDDREAAENARLDLELDLHRKGVEHEVVLLQAKSVEALRKTHRRYFESLRQIVKSASKSGR